MAKYTRFTESLRELKKESSIHHLLVNYECGLITFEECLREMANHVRFVREHNGRIERFEGGKR